MSGLTIAPVGMLTDDELAAVHVVYEEAFPAHLRVPFASLVRTGPADQMVAAVEPQAVAGFAALRLLGPPRWSFLRFFAIASARRGHGLGHRFCHLLGPALTAGG